MRYTASFFWVLFIAAAAGLMAQTYSPDDHTFVTQGPRWSLFTLQAATATFFMTALLWSLLIGFSGGPKKFYASNHAWKQLGQPVPELVPPVDVDTTTVVKEYRTTWSRYLPWARGQASLVIGALPVLLFVGAMFAFGDHLPPVAYALIVCIVPAIIVGLVHTMFVFTRSAILVHPNGVTIQGAWRKVVLDNTTNCGIVRGEAQTSMYDMGSLYINRATRRRGAIWQAGLDAGVRADQVVREACPRSLVHERPSRQLAPYVSFGMRASTFALSVAVLFIVAVVSVAVVAGLPHHA